MRGGEIQVFNVFHKEIYKACDQIFGDSDYVSTQICYALLLRISIILLFYNVKSGSEIIIPGPERLYGV